MKQCLVLGGSDYVAFLETINAYSKEPIIKITQVSPYEINQDLEEEVKSGKYSLVLFSGGADVSPEIYGEKQSMFTVNEPTRDALEQRIYNAALESKTKMLGICRGSQFLTAMQEGGKLVQHVLGHTRSHYVEVDAEYLPESIKNPQIEVTSTHHQMMDVSSMDEDSYVVIASVSEKDAQDRRDFQDPEFGKMMENDIKLVNIPFAHNEIVYYINTNCLAIQGHPEFRNQLRIKDNFGAVSLYLISTLLLNVKVNFSKNTSSGSSYSLEEMKAALKQNREGFIRAENPMKMEDIVDAQKVEEEQPEKGYFFRDRDGNPVRFIRLDEKLPDMRLMGNRFILEVDAIPEFAVIDRNLLKQIYKSISKLLQLIPIRQVRKAVWEVYFELVEFNKYDGLPAEAFPGLDPDGKYTFEYVPAEKYLKHQERLEMERAARRALRGQLNPRRG